MKIVNTTAGQTDENLYYVATDFQGSICGLMDEAGVMLQEYSYDAWGARRDPATWQNYTQTQLTTYSSSLITDRGYTGHEMLDMYGLINMNGRMYDPLVGRFLSADPVVQTAGGSQAYNAYSYALNNPLKYTDPTGYLVSGGIYSPDMQGVNSQLQWKNYNYQNELYGRQEYWQSGGSNLTRIQNYGGGFGAVWDGANHESATIFLPNSMFGDGSYYVNSIVPTPLLAEALAVKYSAYDLATGFFNGTIGWNSQTGFATVALLQAQGLNYATLNGERDLFFDENDYIRMAQLGLNTTGIYSGLNEYNRVVGDLWKSARTGKWYEINKRPNRFTGSRDQIVNGAKFYRRIGKGVFWLSTGLSFYSGVEAAIDGDYETAAKSGLDIAIGYLSMTGPIGFGIGVCYFILNEMTNMQTHPNLYYVDPLIIQPDNTRFIQKYY